MVFALIWAAWDLLQIAAKIKRNQRTLFSFTIFSLFHTYEASHENWEKNQAVFRLNFIRPISTTLILMKHLDKKLLYPKVQELKRSTMLMVTGIMKRKVEIIICEINKRVISKHDHFSKHQNLNIIICSISREVL